MDVSPAGLIARAAAAGVRVTADAADRLLRVLAAARAEEQNLTRITDPAAAFERHLVDSLLAAALPCVRDGAGPVADVGSGLGFPGLALAAAAPDRSVHLIESERRKAAWLRAAAEEFPNVCVVPERSEDVARRARGAYALAVARALGPAPVALELCAPLVGDPGHVVLWRAGAPAVESAGAAAELGLSPPTVVPYAPFPGADRHFQIHSRAAATPQRFPRRPGRAAKRPLA